VTWIAWYPGANRASSVTAKARHGADNVGGRASKKSGASSPTTPGRSRHPLRRYAGTLLAPVIAVLAVTNLVAVLDAGQSHNQPADRPMGALSATQPVGAPITSAPLSSNVTAAASPVPASTLPTIPVAPVVTPGSPTTAAVAGPPATPATAVTTPAQPPSVPATTASTDNGCSVALAYLAIHAKPGFAHYCRPGPLNIGIAHAVSYTCMPGNHTQCPDGGPEIVIAKPSCAVSYEDEASNSYWDFASSGVIAPGSVQNGRTWDPYGECP